MAKKFAELQAAADIIKNETAEGANTATRVGGTIRDIVDKMQSNNELAQTTGSSTTTAMSQDAVTKELLKRKEYEEYTRRALTGQEEAATANYYPFVRIEIENSNGSGWNTLNDKLSDINTIATPKYNGWIRYFLSGQAIDVVNRVLLFVNKTTSQVATGPLVISNGKLAYSGDVDKSFARIYKGGSWSPWAPVNSGDPGISSSFYKTSLDLEAVDEGSPLSSSDMEKILLIQDALNTGKTIISSVGVLNASIVYRRPSYIINISYIKGSEMRILSATAPRYGGTWHAQNIDLANQSGGEGIDDAPSDGKVYGRKDASWSELNEVITIEGLLDLVDAGTVTSENLNTIFGVSTYSGISAKIKDKILLAKSDFTPSAVVTSACTGSEDDSIIMLTSVIMGNAFYFTLNFNNDILSRSSIKVTQLVEDAPSNGKQYVRKDGDWVEARAVSTTLYYTETKDTPVDAENYITTEYPWNPYNGGHDFKIVRFTVTPGAAHTGPSFMLFDGDYKYFAKWPAIGIYPSSDQYFSSGSGFIPKEGTPYVKIGSTEQVHYQNKAKKFYNISF